jgi:hypothetical protein
MFRRSKLQKPIREFRAETVMKFQVLVGKEPRPVNLAFGPKGEVNLRGWRLPQRFHGHEPAHDAIEYARLANKRWRYYDRTGHVLMSLEELRNLRGRREEFAFLILARADWYPSSSLLGFAHCRRTWCGHIFLDFLSVHPRIAAQAEPRIRGVGAGILYGLCSIAAQCGISVVWGETTISSVPFYRKVLGRKSLLDCLTISGGKFRRCCSEFDKIRIDNP